MTGIKVTCLVPSGQRTSGPEGQACCELEGRVCNPSWLGEGKMSMKTAACPVSCVRAPERGEIRPLYQYAGAESSQ